MDFRVAPQAESDLDEIWYFLATQSSNRAKAGSFTPRFLSHHNRNRCQGRQKTPPISAALPTLKLLSRRCIHARPMPRHQSRVNCSAIESGSRPGPDLSIRLLIVHLGFSGHEAPCDRPRPDHARWRIV